MISAATTEPSEIAGRIIPLRLANRLSAGETYPDEGSQPSQIEKTRMRTIPRKNCGMATPLTAITVPAVSTQVFGRSAEKIPMGTAISRAKRIPRANSSRVMGSLWPEEGQDVGAGPDGDPEIAADERPQPFEVLDHDRLVQTQLLADALDHLLTGALRPHDGQRRIARQHHGEGKGDQAHDKERDQGLQDSSDEKGFHWCSFMLMSS